MFLRTKIGLIATIALVTLSVILISYGEIKEHWSRNQYKDALLQGDQEALTILLKLDERYLRQIADDLSQRPATLQNLVAPTASSLAQFNLDVQNLLRFQSPQPKIALFDAHLNLRESFGEINETTLASALRPMLAGPLTSSAFLAATSANNLPYISVKAIRDRDAVIGYIVVYLDYIDRLDVFARNNTSVVFVDSGARPIIISGDLPDAMLKAFSCCSQAPYVRTWSSPAPQTAYSHAIMTVLPVGESTSRLNGALYFVRDVSSAESKRLLINQLSYIGVIIFVLMSVALLMWLLRSQFRPLSAVVEVLGQLSKGATNVGLRPIRAAREIQTLADSLETFRQGQTARLSLIALNEQISSASRIQQDILPKEFDLVAEVDIFAQMMPAQDIGGDFFDFFLLENGNLGVVVADAAGKGVGSALFASTASALIRGTAQFCDNPAEILERTNNALCARNEESLFLTCFFAILEPKTGRLTYANAGHCPPMLAYDDARVEMLELTGDIPLGVLSDFSFQNLSLTLPHDVALLMYSDGFDEAEDPNGTLLGLQHAREIVVAQPRDDCKAFVKGVQEEISRHLGSNSPNDDVTLAAIRLKRDQVNAPHR